MRKIKLDKWKSKAPIYSDDNVTIVGTKEIDEDLLNAFNMLIANKDPKDMPRGLDKFRTYSRLSKAFEKADKSRVLELEETDYKFLKESIENEVPSSWGMNSNISKAVEDFLEAKEQ